jgi:predicted HicB family RNase H-like nuclease
MYLLSKAEFEMLKADYLEGCKLAGIKPSVRQRRRFRMKKGAVYNAVISTGTTTLQRHLSMLAVK